MTFKAYRVLAFAGLSLNTGALVALFAHQAASRAAQLEPLAEGGYRVAGSVQFKAGEVVGLPDDISRALAAKLEPVDFEALIVEERARLADLEKAIAAANDAARVKAEVGAAASGDVGLDAPPARKGSKGGKA